MSGEGAVVADEPVVQALLQHLFADPALGTFAILDGAAIPDLLPKLNEEAPEHICLYRGELEPDLAECAPYLVRLAKESAFTKWLLAEGWGKSWGIFVLAAADLTTLRRHFRGFLIVLSPEGKRLYFRYYDPRVLREYLPTCNTEETRTVFGPVSRYFCEGTESGQFLSFTGDLGVPRKTATRVVGSAGASA
jgi:hypothetical protein